MSFRGGSKNPPWSRNAPSGMGGMQGGMGLQQQNVFSNQQFGQQQNAQLQMANQQQLALQQQQQLASQQLASQQLASQQLATQQMAAMGVGGMSQPGIALPTTLGTTPVPTVSYPPPRLNQPPTQPPPQPQPQQPPAPAQQSGQKQRVFTGVVTKLHDTFGFVDDDVFFPANCVKGANPKVGDRVLVEASYNAAMPFKWSATRIQVLPHQNQSTVMTGPPGGMPLKQQMGTSYGNQPSQNYIVGTQGMMQMRDNRSGGGSRGMERSRGLDRAGKDRRRSPPKRDRSPRRSRSPRKSPTRSSSTRRDSRRDKPRYSVQIPKISIDIREASVTQLKMRYTNMYIPSDFFRAKFSWADAFPANRPQSLAHECGYHIMHKEAESVTPNDAVLEPSDASHLYSAKVMLLALPGLEALYQRSCCLADEEPKDSYKHPTRLIQFLVGLKGKGEPLAIGGPWSATLDGSNPRDDPTVLINTAKRTCRALTGIDLSSCTQWYRFAEIQYYRPEETRKGRHLPARVETTVLFLPDVWSCVPSSLEWETLQSQYMKLITTKDDMQDEDRKEDDEEEDDDQYAEEEEDKKPTHYSQLDLKTMKVAEIRYELEARSLNAKGMKSQLLARLTKAVKAEKEEEEEQQEGGADSEQTTEEEAGDGATSTKGQEKMETETDDVKQEKEDSGDRKKPDPEKLADIERLYKLPNERAIIVHPNKEAKSGKFDCTVMSLSVLLDYRPEDNKEHSFEVSLFAELFNEMIMRDFGFNIYKALVAAPEREDKKEKKDRDEEKSEKEAKRRKLEDEDEKKDSPKKEKEDKEDEKSEEKTNEDESNDERREAEAEVKQRTVDPALLLSCVYFDLNHCGYIAEKDLEEILHILGLQLSRSQIHKLVQKQTTKDQWQYRKLTDRPETESATPLATDKLDLSDLAAGNAPLTSGQQIGQNVTSPRKPPRQQTSPANVTDAGMVTYRGALIDVASVMDKLDQSDQDQTKLEQKLAAVRHEMEKIKDAHVDDLTLIANLRKELESAKSELEKIGRNNENLKEANLNLAEFARSVRHLAEDVDNTVRSVLNEEPSSSQDTINGVIMKTEAIVND